MVYSIDHCRIGGRSDSLNHTDATIKSRPNLLQRALTEKWQLGKIKPIRVGGRGDNERPVTLKLLVEIVSSWRTSNGFQCRHCLRQFFLGSLVVQKNTLISLQSIRDGNKIDLGIVCCG
jgi:hypothetical protein